VPFHQQKKGFPSLTCRVMNSWAAATVSSSIVSIRFLVSGGVLNDLATVAIRLGPKHTLRANFFKNSASFG
jgi:hypothetical protein